MIIDLEESIRNSFENQGIAVMNLSLLPNGKILIDAITPIGIIHHEVGAIFYTRPTNDY